MQSTQWTTVKHLIKGAQNLKAYMFIALSCNPLKPFVKSRIKIYLEQHLIMISSDQ